MARYSLGPTLRFGLPPYGRHHSAALMQFLPKKIIYLHYRKIRYSYFILDVTTLFDYYFSSISLFLI